MKGLARFSISNPAFNHVLTALIIAVGTFSVVTIPQELNPLVAFNWLFVMTDYPGASPQEVEKEVTIPLEDELANLEDLDFFTSESYESSSLFFVRFKQMSDAAFDRRIQDVENAINKTSLPDEAEETDVEEFTSYNLRPVVEVGIYGDLPQRVLNDAAENIKRQILRLDDIDDVEIFGMRDREIRVELDPHRMQYYRLSNSQIIDAIRARNLNLPGGIIKMGNQEYLVRTQAEFTSIDEIAKTIVFSDADGFRVTVGDVATVQDDYSDPSILTRIEGRPCLILTVVKTEKGNSLRIVTAIDRLLKDLRRTAPEGLSYRLINNSTVEIKHSLNILKSNALMGLILVLVLLYLFLGWRSALAAAIGIPVSFLLTMTFLRFTGETLNQSSLFALVLVLGMVVDDAIVIVENCHTKLHEGKLQPRQAIVEGISQVARPVIASSVTTIFGFMPLMLMPGIMGRFMRVIPLVVCATLVTSLFEAFVILPGHVNTLYAKNRGKGQSTGVIRLVWLQRSYAKLLVRSIRHRYLFMVGIVLLLLLSMALAGALGFDLFAEDALPSFKVLVQMPTGTRLERTEEVLLQIAEAVSDLPEEELDHISLRAGLIQGAEIWTFLPSVGQVAINLVPHHLRKRSVEEIADSVRTRVEKIPGPKTIRYQLDSSAPPAGSDLQILIKGRHLAVLEEINRDLQGRLSQIPGVRDIYDDISRATRELSVRVDPDRARRYGVTVSQVASELRTAFNGTTATVLHDGDEDVDVIVRYASADRSRVADVLGTHFRVPSGEMVAFEDIASLKESIGLSNIRRHNSERAITVRASVNKQRTSLSDAVAQLDEIFVDLERAYPGYRISLWGQWKEFIESFRSLGLLFGFGLMLIYLLLVGQFRSLVQPIIILSIVPLSFIGAAIGLLVLQRPVTIATMYGLIALAGVAVNDSIVLVDFINNLRKRLVNRRQALVLAGQQRLRPVILTSVTTIVGLLPMAIGLGGSTGAWQSLSVTIVSGLVFATAISLFGIPVMISVTDDIKAFFGLHPPEPEDDVGIILRATTPRPAGGEKPHK